MVKSMDKTLFSLKYKRLIWTNCWNTRLERSGEVFAKAQFSLLWPWGHFRCRVITQRVLLRQSLPRLQPTTVKVCFLRNLENYNVTFALKITRLCEWSIESVEKCFVVFFHPHLHIKSNKSSYIAGICFRMKIW